MSTRDLGGELSAKWFALGLVLLCGLALLLGARSLDTPGLYYDEVVQAEPAVQFLAESGRPVEIPGMKTQRAFGGWFPVMTQSYMGALKSQLLIPVFAVVDPTPKSLRATTFAFGLLGLVLSVLLARALLGTRVGLVTGLLLAVDPSVLFVSRHDWGSFALGFLCRSGGLLFLVTALQTALAVKPGDSRTVAWKALAAGLLLGAGLYNKIDAVVVLASILAGAVLAYRSEVLGAVVRIAREQRPAVWGFGVGFALGAAPLLASLGTAIGATEALITGGAMGSADWSHKLAALGATLDGSYFSRLMSTGGDFNAMFEMDSNSRSPFPWVLLVATAYLVGRASRARGEENAKLLIFVSSAFVLAMLGLFFTPRAIRIHHILNLVPLPHLIVAAALDSAWRSRARGERFAGFARAVAALAVAILVVSAVRVDLETLRDLRENGGKGRWSDSLARFAGEMARDPQSVGVSLDWGFHGTLRFAERGLALEEPFWRWWRPRGMRRPWVHDGNARHIYFLPTPSLAVFGYGERFRQAVQLLPPESFSIRHHTDRQGDVAFISVKIHGPHRVTRRDGFEIQLR